MIKKILSTDQTPDNIRRVLTLLAEAPGALATLCKEMTEEDVRRPPGPGRRSVAGIVAHLINTEARSNEAIVLALTVDKPLLPKVHAERDYGRLMRHDLMPLGECLDYYRFRRAALLPVLEALSDRQWARVVREDCKRRMESVYWLARGLALHELEHLAEIGGRGEDLSPA